MVEPDGAGELVASAMLPARYRDAYLSYAASLEARGLPVLFNLDHLSDLMGLQPGVLRQCVHNPQKFYRSFVIPKRRGGQRRIASPYPSLLSAQRWILNNILSNVAVNEHAHGYVRDRSNITNARLHLKATALLKMDLQDFFESISKKRVIAVFLWLGYSRDVAYDLASICCLEDRLPQGSACSPSLSNIIAKSLDTRLAALSNEHDVTYSRYSDDLSFSGNHIHHLFSKIGEGIILSEGLLVNREKTILMSRRGRRVVTGVSISSGIAKAPRSFRRMIRQEVYNFQQKGVIGGSFSGGIFDPLRIDRTMGRLYYWQSIEPENVFVLSSIRELRRMVADQERAAFG